MHKLSGQDRIRCSRGLLAKIEKEQNANREAGNARRGERKDKTND